MMMRLYYNMNNMHNSVPMVYTDTEAIEISNLLHDISRDIIENYYLITKIFPKSYGVSINHGYVNIFINGFTDNENVISMMIFETIHNSTNQFYNKYKHGIKYEFFNITTNKMENGENND